MDLVLERAEEAEDAGIWITRLTRAQILAYVGALGDRPPECRPLFGIPFVIKDNIDLAGVPTTAGCPAFAYLPARSAFVVGRLIDAGAIPIGKANLDQSATGLVGTRPLPGRPRRLQSDYIAGGSIQARGGRGSRPRAACARDRHGRSRPVPAAFNNIVGLKPSLARLSCRGVVPACRSLDCVSILRSPPRTRPGFFRSQKGSIARIRTRVPRRIEGWRSGGSEYRAAIS